MKKQAVLVLTVFVMTLFSVAPFTTHAATCTDADADGLWSVAADGTGECSTIQDAVDSAEDGAVIQLEDGTYDEEVVIDGKYLTIQGNASDNSAVVIDTNYLYRPFTFENADTGTSLLQNLTITQANSDTGGAVYVYNAAMTTTRTVVAE